MKNWFVRFLSILFCFVSIGFSTQFAIQAQNNAGTTLNGKVVDDVDAVIPGAKVTLVLPGGKQRVVATNATGDFSIPNVAAGVYNFYIQVTGFKPFVISDLKMPRTEALTATMQVGDVEIATEVTDVANGVTVEPDQNLSATVLGQADIDNLPNNEDDLRDVLQAMAGPGASAAGGGQGGGAEIMVNGFRGGRLPPKDAILKITINQNPYSAEFSQPGFGRIEITTKPGNDTWRGSISTSFRNSALDARNAFAQTKPDVSQQQYSFNISGPLIKKKMSFFAFGERRNLTGGSTTTAIIPTGPFVANVLAPADSMSFNIRTDYLINQKNTLGVSYQHSKRNSLNQEFAVSFGGGFGGGPGGGGGRGGGGASGVVNYTLPERGTDSNSAGNDLQITNTSIITSRLINEARLRFGYDTSTAKARTAGIAINVLDAFNGGGSTTGLSNSRTFDYELQDYLTYTLKKHTLKGGVQVQYEKNRNYSLNNFNGTYTFPGLSAYCGAAGIICSSNTARGVYQFTVNTGDPLLRYSQSQYSYFLNDDIRVSQAFTLSLGVRHELQQHLDDKSNIAPRVGIAWSPFKDRKTSFRAGAGLFYQRLSAGTYSQILRFNGTTQQSFTIRNPVYNKDYKPGDPLPLSCDDNLQNCVAKSTLQSTIIRTLDTGIRSPYSYNVNASVERQLPRGLAATVNFIYSRGLHQFRVRNINAIRFDQLGSCTSPLDINCTRPNKAQGDIYQIESSAKSEAKILAVQLNRRAGKYFSFFANYSLASVKNDSDGIGSPPPNNYDLSKEWGPTTFMSRQSFFLMGRISLPKGIGLSPMLNLRSGSPFGVTLGQDLNRDNNYNDRPLGITRNADLPASLYAQVAGCRSSIPDPTNAGKTICTQTLTQYLTQNFPNGIKAIGPGTIGFNLNISKTFGFVKKKDNPNAAGGGMGGGGGGGRDGGGRGGGGGGMGGMMGGMGGGGGRGGGGFGGGGGAEGFRYSLQVQAQITNLFNHVNPGQYSGTLTSPYFGASNSASAGRQFELSMRFSF